MRNKTKKVILVVGLQLVIAAFFISGAERANPPWYVLYQSYFADIFLPFVFIFFCFLLKICTLYLKSGG
ncbi:hypothetical protein ACFLZP_00590 [Patescibacteria group bacterium]